MSLTDTPGATVHGTGHFHLSPLCFSLVLRFLKDPVRFSGSGLAFLAVSKLLSAGSLGVFVDSRSLEQIGRPGPMPNDRACAPLAAPEGYQRVLFCVVRRIKIDFFIAEWDACIEALSVQK